MFNVALLCKIRLRTGREAVANEVFKTTVALLIVKSPGTAGVIVEEIKFKVPAATKVGPV